MLLTVLVVTGCTVTLSPADGSANETPSATPSPSSSRTAVPSPSASSTGAAIGGDLSGLITRADAQAAVDQQLTCTGASFVVDQDSDARVVEVTGDCTDVTIEADGATVLLQNVATLSVDADVAMVFVTSAEAIVLGGAGNTVVWAAGTPSGFGPDAPQCSHATTARWWARPGAVTR